MQTEFGFIRNLRNYRNFSLIGDDCAVLPKDSDNDLVITLDMLVENVDFRLRWATPEQIGHKALAVSLSDIAAMGGIPKWTLLSIAFPAEVWKTDFPDRFYDGYCKLAERFGVEYAGGDISQSPDTLVVDSVVGGEVERGRAILRSGARPGDLVCVSGSLGGAAAGLAALERGATADSARLLLPEPRVELGRRLFATGQVTAMIDISDGLSGDLWHICEMSGVGASIELGSIPVDPIVDRVFSAQNDRFDCVLNGGEDFELLFSASPDFPVERFSDDVSVIGVITANTEIMELTDGGRTSGLVPGAFSHF